MRTWGTAAIAVALAACGGGAKAPTASAPPTTASHSPTASPTPKDTRPSLAVVKAALAATRAKGTATYTMEATTSFGAGHFTMNREGSYDVRNARAKVTQSFEAEPKELAKQLLGEEVDIDDLVAHSIAVGDVGYLQMPGWPASIRSRWLRFTQADISRITGSTGADVGVVIFPPALEMLAEAKATNVPVFGNTHYVTVSAPDAIAATPGSSAPRALQNAGVDIESLPGTVQVAVEVVGGVVTSLKFDTIEVFRDAWKKAGMAQLADAITSIETIVTFTGHGQAVSIAAPPASAVMSERELENAR